jgi:acetoin utilization protein AcuB
MTGTVKTITPDTSCEDAWNVMRQNRIHHLAVTRGRQVVGVLSERDCGGRSGKVVREGRTVADVMSAPALTVPPETTVKRAANVMRGRSVGCLIVTRDSRAVGIVTVSDLLELVGRGAGARAGSEPRAALHHRTPHRKSSRQDGRW